jgi:hypothetical protein
MIYRGFMIFKKDNRKQNHIIAKLGANPSCKAGEISMKIEVDLPDKIFERPRLEAKWVVPKEKVPDALITAEIKDNVEQALKEALGMDIIVSIKESKPEQENTAGI